MDNTEQAQEMPQSEAERIRVRKRHVVDTMQAKFSDPVWKDRLMKICGQDESKLIKAMQSFIAYIMADDGGAREREKKNYIADCSLSSISTAFLEAFQMGIEVGGGRDHAYLVNYAGQCELEISYKGFIYALNKHFDNAYVEADNVFRGEKFTWGKSNENAVYEHQSGSEQIEQNWNNYILTYCYFSYTLPDSNVKVSRLMRIPKADMDKIRSKARGSHAWRDFLFEQCKKSALRRAAKIPFASIDFIDEEVNPEEVDNRHYELQGYSSEERVQLLLDKSRELFEDEKPKKDASTKDPAAGQPADNSSVASDNKGKPSNADVEKEDNKNNAEPTNEEAVKNPAEDDEDNEAKEQISDADFEDVEEDPAPQEWTGIYIDGKLNNKVFETPEGAARYIEKIMSNRKRKESRLKMIEENNKLISALIKSGKGELVNSLHKLASEGE